MASPRIATLDGIRAVAIGLVLVAHCSGTGLYSIPRLGHFLADLGVRVFFVLSGYLITSLLLREHARTGAISLRAFYLRRAFRIFPALYVFIAVTFLVWWPTLHEHDAIFASTFTMNFHGDRAWQVGHLWSLAVEEQFYLLWPGLLAIIGLRAGMRVALAALALAPIARLAIWYGVPSLRDLSDQAFPCVFDSLASGCLLAMLRERLEARVDYRRVLESRWLPPVLMLGIGASLVTRPAFSLGIAMSLSNVAIALAIHRCLLRPPRVLALPAVTKLGLISYSLYLWQQVFVNRHADAWYNGFGVNVLLAVAVATASYHFIEQPLLRLSARIQERLRSADA